MHPYTRKLRNKGWSAKKAGQRWGIGTRQMLNICKAPSQKDWDALNGLPILIPFSSQKKEG